METIEITVDPALRADAQQVLAEEGLTIGEAVEMFLKTVVHDGSLPAVYRVPNEETLAAIREAESGTLPKYADAKSFMRSLVEDD